VLYRGCQKESVQNLEDVGKQNGCSFDYRVVAYAGCYGYNRIVKWVAKNNRLDKKYGHLLSEGVSVFNSRQKLCVDCK